MGYGEVTVRKDLSAVSGEGRPRVGYLRKRLVQDVEAALGLDCLEPMVLVGAGKLGTALMGGIITVPEATAQKVCDAMLAAGITEIWNFAPCRLRVPEGVTVQQENLALSVANLHMCAKRSAHRISPTEQKGTHDEGTELSDC